MADLKTSGVKRVADLLAADSVAEGGGGGRVAVDCAGASGNGQQPSLIRKEKAHLALDIRQVVDAPPQLRGQMPVDLQSNRAATVKCWLTRGIGADATVVISQV